MTPETGSRTALVAGGAGFIGSHLVDALLADGYRVVVVDNFATGARANLAHVAQDPATAARLTIIEANVREPLAPVLAAAAAAGNALAAEKFSEIYNLASPASPIHYQKDPIDTLLTNIEGAKNVLELALAHGANFLQASTSEVYGDPVQHPQTEAYWGNVNPIGIRACYDEGKRAAETLCFDYIRQRGANVRVARIFNTYGPRMAADDGRVVSNFIVQALRGEDITIYGEGTQTRSFQYVDDLVAGLRAVMAQPKSGPFNIGNPEEYTIMQLAEKVLAMVGAPGGTPAGSAARTSTIVRKPLPQDDPLRRNPDISRARALGWEPKTPLEDGLKKTIAYFRLVVASPTEASSLPLATP